MTSDRTALLVVAVAGAALAAGGHASSNDSIRTCTTSQLEIRLVHSGVAAGTVGGYIRFTNRAAAPCRLSGWPILAAIAADGTSTIAVHNRATMFGPRPTIKGIPVVRLRHGEKADAVFVTSDNPGPGATRCPPPYRHLRVTPPGNSRSVLVSAWLPAYAQYLPACTRIEVSMVVPASALYHG